MYGIFNRAIEHLVTNSAGRVGWNAVRERAGIGHVVFASIRPYPDPMTYDLITATSEVLRCSEGEVLLQLGRGWVQFAADAGFGSLLETGGQDFHDFMIHVDSLHARLALTLPGLIPPSFVVEEQPEGVLHVHYYSKRAGLAPLVVGMLEGLGDLFEASIDVCQLRERATPEDSDVFAVTPRKPESPV